MIILPNGFKIEIIGKPGSKLLTEMFKEYYDAKSFASKSLKDIDVPNLCIFLGCGTSIDPLGFSSLGCGTSRERSSLGTSVPEAKLFEAKLCETSIDPLGFSSLGTSVPEAKLLTSVPYLIGILKKSDYEFITNFCKTHNLKLYVANTKKIYNAYSFLNFTIYDYINLALAMTASSISKTSKSSEEEFLSISPEKYFHLRYHKNDNIHFYYEPGHNLEGVKLTMEWAASQKFENMNIHTIFDIDEIPSTSKNSIDSENFTEYLLPFTILGNRQKSFLIVNSEDLEKSSKSSEPPFDYHIYSKLMEIWNNPSYIPKRKLLAEVKDHAYDKLRSESKDFTFSSKSLPIFILDDFESIKNSLRNFKVSEVLILYIGKKENFQKIIAD